MQDVARVSTDPFIDLAAHSKRRAAGMRRYPVGLVTGPIASGEKGTATSGPAVAPHNNAVQLSRLIFPPDYDDCAILLERVTWTDGAGRMVWDSGPLALPWSSVVYFTPLPMPSGSVVGVTIQNCGGREVDVRCGGIIETLHHKF